MVTQAILWIFIRSLLSWIYQENPGVFFEKPHSMGMFLAGIWNGNSHWAMENAAWFLTLFAGICLPTSQNRIPVCIENKWQTGHRARQLPKGLVLDRWCDCRSHQICTLPRPAFLDAIRFHKPDCPGGNRLLQIVLLGQNLSP